MVAEKVMKSMRNQWKSMDMEQILWILMKSIGRSTEIDENQREINGNEGNVNENSMKVIENR